MQDFRGKVAFITGGGSGAGLGQAKVFAEAGCKVVIADIRKQALMAAMDYFKTKNHAVHAIELDITDRNAFERAADETEKVFGTVQLLFNTAGVSQFGPIEKSTFDDWDWQIGVNYGGVLNGVKTFAPRMIAHGQGGHIVNTASMSAFNASSIAGIYSVSKFAVRALSEAFRDALAKYNIGVSCLCPMNINTEIADSVKTRPAKYKSTGFDTDEREIAALREIYAHGMDPEELARHVMEGIKKNAAYIIPYPEARQPIINSIKKIVADILPADPVAPAPDQAAMQKGMEAMRAWRDVRQEIEKEEQQKFDKEMAERARS
ncbi:MAG TPA: SDR family NAD(P)-dependent oxidoreductase [Alphaproteobacteria bacterium]|nr:SDR family NAD(P)-dependent oxidoreductase [Alphaproteobacteria bacterium]